VSLTFRLHHSMESATGTSYADHKACVFVMTDKTLSASDVKSVSQFIAALLSAGVRNIYTVSTGRQHR
jgi:hypothetical protein